MKKIRLIDPWTAFILQHTNKPELLGELFEDYLPDNGQSKVRCPIHGDTAASLHIYPAGDAHCFGCRFHADDLIELYSKLNGITYAEGQDTLYRRIVDIIPEENVFQFERNLVEAPWQWLTVERNISPSSIKQFHLGFDPLRQRVTIPIPDAFGYYRNIRYVAWVEEQVKHGKILNERGNGEVRLFPEPALSLTNKVVLVEGELDCIVARQYGIPAFTTTGGCGAWRPKFTEALKGKTVWMLYDNDEAGRKGAVEVAMKLLSVCAPLTTFKTEWCSSKLGKDITDWSFTCPKFLQSIADEVKQHKVERKKIEPRKQFCPTCGRPL